MAEFNWTIDDIKRVQRDFSNNFMRLDCIRTESYDVAIDCMTECIEKKAADVQPIGRWISVKDRLPDESCECLGVVDGEVTEVSYSPKQKGLICVWSMCDADGFKPLSDDAVTHWMPMPEPPKDGDSE